MSANFGDCVPDLTDPEVAKLAYTGVNDGD